MSMKLKFNSIKNQSIFQPEFQSFSANKINGADPIKTGKQNLILILSVKATLKIYSKMKTVMDKLISYIGLSSD